MGWLECTFRPELSGTYKLWGQLESGSLTGTEMANEILSDFCLFMRNEEGFDTIPCMKVSIDEPLTIVIYLSKGNDLWGRQADVLREKLKAFGVGGIFCGGYSHAHSPVITQD